MPQMWLLMLPLKLHIETLLKSVSLTFEGLVNREHCLLKWSAFNVNINSKLTVGCEQVAFT